MPLDKRHDSKASPPTQEIHNVYGMLMTRSGRGLLKLKPQRQPFILRAPASPAASATRPWPGDNVSNWAHLRASVQVLLAWASRACPSWATTSAAS
jgi:alpha-glucosidase (family GH31 glycosyl hydrolase)